MQHSDTFKPQPSTWDLILQYCPPNEIGEVKELLGISLVEQAIDLHVEVSRYCQLATPKTDDSQKARGIDCHRSLCVLG